MDAEQSPERTLTDKILLGIARFYGNKSYPFQWMNKYLHVIVPLGNLIIYSILWFFDIKFTNLEGFEDIFPNEFLVAMYIFYFILTLLLLYYIYSKVIPSYNSIFPTEELQGDTLILLIYALSSGIFFSLAKMNLIFFDPILKTNRYLINAIIILIGLILTILNYKIITQTSNSNI